MDEPRHPQPYDLDVLRERESARLTAIHHDHAPLNTLAAAVGTPEEWLATAISHLKVQSSGDARAAGTATVSIAAIDLVLMRLEALEEGGSNWPGNSA